MVETLSLYLDTLAVGTLLSPGPAPYLKMPVNCFQPQRLPGMPTALWGITDLRSAPSKTIMLEPWPQRGGREVIESGALVGGSSAFQVGMAASLPPVPLSVRTLEGHLQARKRALPRHQISRTSTSGVQLPDLWDISVV